MPANRSLYNELCSITIAVCVRFLFNQQLFVVCWLGTADACMPSAASCISGAKHSSGLYAVLGPHMLGCECSLPVMQVWNANRCSGLVAVFHLQGSSWDRARRQFCMHDSQPAPCSTHVSPADIESFTSQALQPCKPVSAGKNGRALLSDVSSSSSSSSGSSSSAREFIAWSEAFGNNRMKRLGLRDRVPIELAGGF